MKKIGKFMPTGTSKQCCFI